MLGIRTCHQVTVTTQKYFQIPRDHILRTRKPDTEPEMECPHLERLARGGGPTTFPCLQDPRTPLACAECGARESVWLCVTCGALNCGRYIQAHGLMHKVRHSFM